MAITVKQARFLSLYFGEANGNGRLAAEQAGYKGSPATLSQTSYEVLRSPEVQRLTAGILTPEGVQMELTAVATIDPAIIGALPSKVRSLELLGRIHGLLSDRLTIGLDRDSVLAAIQERLAVLANPVQSTEPAALAANSAIDSQSMDPPPRAR
jgi:hypothetical protein